MQLGQPHGPQFLREQPNSSFIACWREAIFAEPGIRYRASGGISQISYHGAMQPHPLRLFTRPSVLERRDGSLPGDSSTKGANALLRQMTGS